MSRLEFPKGFLWGVATSAYQIEGATTEDGRGESIWDRFASIPGKIAGGESGRRACDHYHRWREDIELMQWLGVGAYRFSIAWPRVLPQGRGPVNVAGLDFYDQLVDGLLDAGIEPFPTLYHWDLPQILEDEGGWPERSTAEAFVEYADAVSRRLGDRVTNWTTHNEPWCAAILGYEEGQHAPGRTEPGAALAAAHHLLLSHAWGMKAIRENVPEARVGIVLNLTPGFPVSQDPDDRDAARWFDGYFNRWYLDPLFKGRYPEDAIQDRVVLGHLPSDDLPFLETGDLQDIAAPMDFLGVNYYSRVVVSAGKDSRPVPVRVVPEHQLTEMGWEVYPEGLTDLMLRLKEEYGPKSIIITENGAAFSDVPGFDGRTEDVRRQEYYHSHLDALHEALERGAPVEGYFAWSLMDNFEWAHAYARRFGLFWVDFRTLERSPKSSAHWYREVIRANALTGKARPFVPRRIS